MRIVALLSLPLSFLPSSMSVRAHLLFCFLPFCALIAVASTAHAQQPDTVDAEAALPDVELYIGGTLQPRFSHGRLDLEAPGRASDRERSGFGVRRARLRTTAELPGPTGVYFQFAAEGPSTFLYDAEFFFDVTEALRLRAGRFTPAQPRAARLTSHTEIDLVARAAIANRWDDGTLGSSGRDFGVEAFYATDRFTTRLALHNGDGNWTRTFGNVRPNIVGDPTRGSDTRGLAASAYGAWSPAVPSGLEVGGYAGYNAARNRATRPPDALLSLADTAAAPSRAYFSYSGHAYWGPQPGSRRVRLKADLIGTRYETLSPGEVPGGGGALEQHALGASLLGAVAFFDGSAELLARAERYDTHLGTGGNTTDYLSAGASVSLSALRGRPYERQRLTLSYTRRLGPDGGAHLLVLQGQLLF